MSLLVLIASIHFLLGGIGIIILNRKLAIETKKKNWLKYFVYLFIYLVVLMSIIYNKILFLGLSIIILSFGLLELLKLYKNVGNILSRNRILVISLMVFSFVAIFFFIFILLPTHIIAFTYTIVVIFDGASQISGQLTGKKKIIPLLSPDKTLEGLIGGTVMAIITSILLHDFAVLSVFQSFFLGLLICIFSFLGDLAASAYKRVFNTKDFGKILPGQGGILDRFDSFLASGAMIALLSIFKYF